MLRTVPSKALELSSYEWFKRVFRSGPQLVAVAAALPLLMVTHSCAQPHDCTAIQL